MSQFSDLKFEPRAAAASLFDTTSESLKCETFVVPCSFGMSGSRKIIGSTERAHVIVRLVRSICDEDLAIVRFAGFMPHAVMTAIALARRTGSAPYATPAISRTSSIEFTDSSTGAGTGAARRLTNVT